MPEEFLQTSDTTWEFNSHGLMFFVKKFREEFEVDVYTNTGKLTSFVDYFHFEELKMYCKGFANGWLEREIFQDD